MKSAFRNSSASFHCLVSAVALAGSLVGWNLWFVSGGWERHAHWGEGTLWAISTIIGFWAAVDAIRFARPHGSEGVTVAVFATLLGIIHLLSFLLWSMFVSCLAEGGPRPQ